MGKRHMVSKKSKENQKNAINKRELEFHDDTIDICSACGFDKNVRRHPVFLCSNPLSIEMDKEMRCPECGHIKDGSTIEKSVVMKKKECE